MKTSNHIQAVTIPNNGVAIGKQIAFRRNNKEIHATVIHIKEASVIVHLQKEDIEFLGLQNELTVVHHKNYKVLED